MRLGNVDLYQKSDSCIYVTFHAMTYLILIENGQVITHSAVRLPIFEPSRKQLILLSPQQAFRLPYTATNFRQKKMSLTNHLILMGRTVNTKNLSEQVVKDQKVADYHHWTSMKSRGNLTAGTKRRNISGKRSEKILQREAEDHQHTKLVVSIGDGHLEELMAWCLIILRPKRSKKWTKTEHIFSGSLLIKDS